MMSTLQHYFTYKCSLKCGIPSVTFFGQKSDWEFILRRIEKLQTSGKEPVEWSKLLVPVITRFLSAFEDPDSKGNKDFWQKSVHHYDGGSGPACRSSRLTAFFF